MGMVMGMAIPVPNLNLLGDLARTSMKMLWRTKALYLAAGLLTGLSGQIPAAEWNFSESISTSLAFTDNVELVEEDPESDWAFILSPNFLLSGQGRRLSVSLAAALTFVSGSEETFYPNIRAFGHSELVKNRFFVDAFATAYQTRIDPLRPAGRPINRTGNLTTTYSVGVNPYYVHRFRDVADLRVDYRYRHQFYVSEERDDRDYNEFFFTLNSGRYFSALDWSLVGRYQKTTYETDSASDTTFRSVDLNIGYPLTSSLTADASIGWERNDYQSERKNKDGPRWSVGVTWVPISRFSLRAGYRHRFDQDHPYVDISYRRRRSVFRLGYRVDLESGLNEPVGQNVLLVETDPLGNPVDPFTGDPLDLDQGVDDVTDNGANIAERFTASYYYAGRRTTFGLNARYTDRDYENSPREIFQWRLGASLTRQLGRQLSLRGIATWWRDEDQTGFRADTWEAGVRVIRGLGDHSNLVFSYTFAQRESNQIGDDYKENRIALVLTTTMVGLAKHADLL